MNKKKIQAILNDLETIRTRELKNIQWIDALSLVLEKELNNKCRKKGGKNE